MKKGISWILTFMETLFLLWLLLVLTALIPNDWLREKMLISAESYRYADAFSFEDGESLNAVSDNYADSILLNISWQMGRGNPLVSTLDTGYYDGEEVGENYGLYLSVTEDAEANTDYTRYFHGSAMLVRLCHLFTDVGGMKLLGFLAACLLVALTCWVLVRRGQAGLAAALLLALAAVQFWNIRLSLEYQPAFMITFLICPMYLWAESKDEDRLVTLSIVGGVTIAFFDFLTTETMTILLPLALVLAVRGAEDRLKDVRSEVLLLVRCGLAWGLSYMGTFLVKWTAASLVIGENAFRAAMDSVAERVGGDIALAEQPGNFFSAVIANFTMLFGGSQREDMIRVVIGVGITALILLSLWYLFRAKKGKREAAFLVMIPGAVVILRYLVLNNHSFLHCFFTYRALVTLVFGVLAALWLNIQLPRKKGGGR